MHGYAGRLHSHDATGSKILEQHSALRNQNVERIVAFRAGGDLHAGAQFHGELASTADVQLDAAFGQRFENGGGIRTGRNLFDFEASRRLFRGEQIQNLTSLSAAEIRAPASDANDLGLSHSLKLTEPAKHGQGTTRAVPAACAALGTGARRQSVVPNAMNPHSAAIVTTIVAGENDRMCRRIAATPSAAQIA